MRWSIIIVFGAWFLAGTFMISRRYWHQWQGARTCDRWLCPKCAIPFGKLAEIRQWQRRKDIGTKSTLFSEPTAQRVGLMAGEAILQTVSDSGDCLGQTS